jgi:membrane-bound ClpP family serine protease
LPAWRVVLLAVADDVAAFILMAIALAWLTLEGVLAPAVAVVAGAAGTALLTVIAYKTAVALMQKPKFNVSMVGRRGIAVTEIAASGMVLIEGEMWRAWSAAPIEKGAAVVVHDSEGLRLAVSAEKMGEGA